MGENKVQTSADPGKLFERVATIDPLDDRNITGRGTVLCVVHAARFENDPAPYVALGVTDRCMGMNVRMSAARARELAMALHAAASHVEAHAGVMAAAAVATRHPGA